MAYFSNSKYKHLSRQIASLYPAPRFANVRRCMPQTAAWKIKRRRDKLVPMSWHGQVLGSNRHAGDADTSDESAGQASHLPSFCPPCLDLFFRGSTHALAAIKHHHKAMRSIHLACSVPLSHVLCPGKDSTGWQGEISRSHGRNTFHHVAEGASAWHKVQGILKLSSYQNLPILIVGRVILRFWLTVLCDGLWRPLSCSSCCT